MENFISHRIGAIGLRLGAVLCATAALAGAQTASDAIFTHQYNHALTYSQYIDLDADGSNSLDKRVPWVWPNTSGSRYYEPFRIDGPSEGACYELWFSQQSPTPVPDWSLWVQFGDITSTDWRKISDNYNGTLLPRMRVWVHGTWIFMRISAGALTTDPTSGAAWFHLDRKTFDKSYCETSSIPTVSHNGSTLSLIRSGP